MTIVTAITNEVQSKSVLRTGYDLAAAYKEKMLVLHVISKGEFVARQQSVRSLDEVPQEPLNQEKKRAEEEVKRLLKEALGEHNVVDIDVVVQVGDPADSILEFGKAEDARYLVIGGQKRSPTGKALFGSVTQSVLLDADRPVVTVMEEAPDSNR